MRGQSHTAGNSCSLRRRVVLVAALAVTAVALVTENATAASMIAGDFSSYITGNPSTRYVDNCWVELGPVVDSIAFPGYRKIGGVRVNCTSVHTVIKATVWEQYWNGSAWVNWGNSNVGTRYNQEGSGYGLLGILRSPPTCFPYHNYYWRTAALVQTENIGGYRYSDYAPDPSGCTQ